MGSYTPGKLYKPAANETGWDTSVNANSDYIDQVIGYNVKAFGAVGDGATNDATAIQAAIDACNAATGGIVYLPQGTYIVNSQIKVKYKVRLIGAGKRTSGIKAGGSFPTSTPVVILGPGTHSTLFDTTIEHLWIDCNDIAGSIGIYSDEMQEGCTINNVLVIKYRNAGIQADFTSSGCQNMEIAGIELFPSASGATYGINWTVSVRSAIRDVSCVTSGATQTYGIYLSNSNNCLIENVQMDGPTTGIYITGGFVACTNIYGSSHTTTVISLASGGGRMTCMNIQRAGTNSIVDALNGTTVTDALVNFYATNDVWSRGAKITVP